MELAKTSPLYLTRFIAAYLVLIVHYSPLSWRDNLYMIRHFGEPVHYFFFISGFVMILSSIKYLSFSDKTIRLNKKDFWMKRIARIYPMYILALMVFVLYNYTVQEIDSSIPKRIIPELTGLNRWVYDGSINYPSWTVSCEFFFYFLFPFSLPLLVKSSLNKLIFITLSLYLLNIAFTFFYEDKLQNILSYNSSYLYKILATSILNHPIFKYTIFLFGCLAGRFYITSPKMLFFTKHSGSIVFVCLALILILYNSSIVKKAFFDSGSLSIIYFFLVLAICSLNERLTAFFSWKPFIFLGDISYGIYIMQAPIEHYFETLFTGGKPFTTSIQFVSYTVFLIAICCFLYYLFEIPAKQYILNVFRKKTLT
ncbi:MAG: acyltransferase [Sphingobacteriaceae bacterium]|nr:MAG: acyltransferase [Sphingobacteriaceae bacterium]